MNKEFDIHLALEELKELDSHDCLRLCFHLKNLLLSMKSVGLGGIERDIQLRELFGFMKDL